MDASNAKLQAMDEREWKDLEELGRAILDQLGAAMRTGDRERAAPPPPPPRPASCSTRSPCWERLRACGYSPSPQGRRWGCRGSTP
ncbi:TipAS antibiotic-recognition domain-containing protein [Hugonella massiliensis]|uniref:TipAS antibiotic-recognition domain-containing protein n=1 Tax=Hugonella massiliensis TaxID=1720315 RepID=UPI0011DD8925|nr:TipAS antibiotic-recognition domain-containing protein [Hugonella massiliensis]